MCAISAYGPPSCNKRPYGFGPKFPTFPRRIVPKDGEGAKNDAEKKVDEKKVDPTKKMPLITYGRTLARVCTRTQKVEKTHLLAAQRSSFKDQIYATFGAEAYVRAIHDKWGES